jgi:quercetin dioxygenase-like cupin family protein
MKGDTVVRASGEGDAFWLLGGLYEVKVAGAETGGALTIMEMTLPAGMGPPPHTHPGAESVYVMEGKIRYHIEDETFDGGPGSFFHIPAGTVENFEPVEPAHLLVVYIPGGMEAFFAEAGEPAARREIPPAPTEPPDIGRLIAIGEKHGLNIVSPATA